MAAAERSLLASLAGNGSPLTPTTSTDSAISDAWHREVRAQVMPELEGSSSAKKKMDMWKRREAGEDVAVADTPEETSHAAASPASLSAEAKRKAMRMRMAQFDEESQGDIAPGALFFAFRLPLFVFSRVHVRSFCSRLGTAAAVEEEEVDDTKYYLCEDGASSDGPFSLKQMKEMETTLAVGAR